MVATISIMPATTPSVGQTITINLTGWMPGNTVMVAVYAATDQNNPEANLPDVVIDANGNGQTSYKLTVAGDHLVAAVDVQTGDYAGVPFGVNTASSTSIKTWQWVAIGGVATVGIVFAVNRWIQDWRVFSRYSPIGRAITRRKGRVPG